jgi:SAM-dependent methyltransferase
MRDTTKALISQYVEQLDLSGEVLEIGGQRAKELFPEPRFAYHSLNPEASDVPNTIVADITDCRDSIPDESFDVVVSSDLLEHVNRPWLVAGEIGRILKPGGLAITHMLLAGDDHSGPVDHWRCSAESLQLLFGDLECLEKGYDLSDAEDRSTYLVCRKGSGPPVTPFQDSDHPLAGYLHGDIQGVAGNPESSTSEQSPEDPLVFLRPALAEITDRLVELEKLVQDRFGQLDAVDARSRRLERRIDRAVASFPLRTMLSLRRALHRMLK